MANPPRGRTRAKGARASLRVDPIACDGVGICSHVAPDLITTDPWGYPVIRAVPVSGRRASQARAAVRACPHRALFLSGKQE